MADIGEVRKPRMAAAVIETDGVGERGILPNQAQRLALLRRTFCEEPTVRKHLQDPETAWDAMLSLNDGGIARLADYLGSVAHPETKLTRIREQVDTIATELVRRASSVPSCANGSAI